MLFLLNLERKIDGVNHCQVSLRIQAKFGILMWISSKLFDFLYQISVTLHKVYKMENEQLASVQSLRWPITRSKLGD